MNLKNRNGNKFKSTEHLKVDKIIGQLEGHTNTELFFKQLRQQMSCKAEVVQPD